jgi:ubiquinone/menaquinone biosynthesis C-methylase UbiE
LEAIPCPDDSFDVVFSVEAIEHSCNRESSVAEMTRVARAGGWVVIIDKQQAHWGRLSCPPWETWPETLEMSRLLSRGCDEVTSHPVGYDDRPAADGLMVVWRGRKRSR